MKRQILSIACAAFSVGAFAASVEFGPKDSGVPGNPRILTPKVLGIDFFRSVELLPSEFGPVRDAAMRERFPVEVRDRIRVADLSTKLPGKLAPWKDDCRIPPSPWLYIGGNPAPLARWPNADDEGGWTCFTAVVDNGYPGGGVEPAGDNVRKNMHPGAFVYDEPRARRWNFKEGVWLYGYWTHDWSESFLRAKGLEQTPSNTVLRLAGVHYYGCGGKTWGGKKSRRFFALNIPEELDAPGEWWLDRERKFLYVLPTEGWPQERLSLAVSEEPILKVCGAHDLVFDGFTFEGTHQTESAAVIVGDCERVTFRNCTFRNLAASALALKGTGCRIENCRAYNLGGGAFEIDGGDRASLVKSGNVVEGCDIHDYSLFRRTYMPAVRLVGCGQTVRGCRIHDAPHSAVIYGGNEHLLESNEIYRVLCETRDAGAFYTGRDSSTLGTVIRGNRFHDLGRTPEQARYTMAVYFDDCDWGDAVYGNRFERVGIGVMLGGGNLHPIVGNTFVECQRAINIDARGITWQTTRVSFRRDVEGRSWAEQKLSKFDFRKDPWKTAYPELEGLLADRPELPRMNPITNNVFIACKKPFAIDEIAQSVTNEMPIAHNRIIPEQNDF